MKIKFSFISLVLILLLPAPRPAHAQGVLRKLKEKAEKEVIEGVFGKEEEPASGSEATPREESSSTAPSNVRGGGLTTTPPDVMENIASAETALSGKHYSDARFSLRQAVQGIEMEMGQNVLDNLPESVKGMNKVPEEDRVSSVSMGFTGLTMRRVYRGGDQQLELTIGNDAVLLASINMYLSMGAYETEENQKRVTFQGNRGVLEYDDYSGYTLSVPFGQSSIFVLNAINFSNEQEIMSAAEEFSIEKIMKELGEK